MRRKAGAYSSGASRALNINQKCQTMQEKLPMNKLSKVIT
jgi:hypothetical protein